MSAYRPGLAGVIAARTSVSHVQGELGRLTVRGHAIEALAQQPWSQAASVVLERPLVDFEVARVTMAQRLDVGRRRGDELALMSDVLDGRPQNAEEALAVVQIATAWAVAGRATMPDVSLDPMEDLLRMAGLPTTADHRRALSAYLITVMDHGLNASTFTARVVASTGSDVCSSVVAGLGALKGPLHGGAPGPVLDMLDAVDRPDQAPAWIRDELEAGRRIMGMGHRVYRVRDPRAAALERALAGLHTDRLDVARAVERAAEEALAARYPGRSLRANVEFYTAILLEALRIPRSTFTLWFAVGRVVGWMAHVEEQRRDGRLIRPSAEYVGD